MLLYAFSVGITYFLKKIFYQVDVFLTEWDLF